MSELTGSEGVGGELGQSGEGAEKGLEEGGGGEIVAGGLSGVKQAALRGLVAGKAIGEVAEAAGVDRRTVSRWIHEDAEFAATFEAWKRETMDSARAEALKLAGAALGTIAGAIEKGNVHVAMEVAKRLGVLKEVKVGETDGKRVKRKRAVRAARREKKLEKLERELDVARNKPVETTEEVDGKIGEWQRVRDRMVMENEKTWLKYEALMALGKERVLRETGWRWPEGPPVCVRPSVEEVRAAIRREAEQEGKSVEDVEWEMQSMVLAERRRYFTFAEVGADTMNWHDAKPREGTPVGKRREEGERGGGGEEGMGGNSNEESGAGESGDSGDENGVANGEGDDFGDGDAEGGPWLLC